ncbi:hypothetical protein QFZ24_006902 [Streptomyces phaeochromogenes]|uniref:hypothetical protein n=1 Tax=Streptomyces phaeochromogenes TaxID=1923 RepID=UPI00279464DA|nr:hypothetical protein [Streptomyces phaeochromogenes]MDQ0952979.1 hypothetical protein [Streptomyces phaeochromogenes]
MHAHQRTHDARTHPHPHHPHSYPRLRHPVTLVGGAAVLVAALLATGCDSAPDATAGEADDPAFSTVRFEFGSRGGIQVFGASRDAVAPAGAHPASAGRAHAFDRPDGRLLVVLRHSPEPVAERASRGRVPRLPPLDEAAVETAFLVDTANWVRADLDGHPLQWLRRDTIRIDTTNVATADTTRLTLSAPHGGRYGQPTPPAGNPSCEGLDDRATRDAVLPEVEAGAPVADVLARLRKQCLDVQYASLPGSARPGTVERVLVPSVGRRDALVAVPPGGSIELPGRTAGSTVLVNPHRPATMVLAR